MAKYLAIKTHLTSVKVQIKTGNELSKNEKSKTGVYAICKKKNGWPLRVSLFEGIADFWRDDSRTINECYVRVIKKL